MKSLISLFNHENIVRYTARLLLDSNQLLIQGVSLKMSSNTTIAGAFLLKHPVRLRYVPSSECNIITTGLSPAH